MNPIHPDLKNVKMLTQKLERYQTQHDKILNYLSKMGNITNKEALIELNIGSLSKRISELRREGYDIESVAKIHPVTGAGYFSYRLAA